MTTIMSAFIYTFLALLFASCCCSVISLKMSSIRIGDDKSNWQALRKVLKDKGSKLEKLGRPTVFDTIILANVRQRATTTKDDGIFLYQGDIRMTKSEAVRLFSGNDSRVRRAAMVRFGANRWTRNSLFYDFHPSLSDKTIHTIRNAIKEWERVLPCLGKWKNIRNLRRGSRRPKAYIQFYRGKGCNSPVGRQGRVQQISIGKGCEKKAIVIHEIGHAMGMWHEQSRPDRDRYVRILWKNIIPAWRFAFRKITPRIINSLGVTYDYESVMHYPSNAFAKRSGLKTMIGRKGYRKMGNTNGLTAKDIEQVRKMYRCQVAVKPKDTCNKKDNIGACQEWSNAGFCDHPLFSKFIRVHCKKSCEC